MAYLKSVQTATGSKGVVLAVVRKAAIKMVHLLLNLFQQTTSLRAGVGRNKTAAKVWPAHPNDI